MPTSARSYASRGDEVGERYSAPGLSTALCQRREAQPQEHPAAAVSIHLAGVTAPLARPSAADDPELLRLPVVPEPGAISAARASMEGRAKDRLVG
jgi:hypothetical protein